MQRIWEQINDVAQSTIRPLFWHPDSDDGASVRLVHWGSDFGRELVYFLNYDVPMNLSEVVKS